jgi:hypothetical protein
MRGRPLERNVLASPNIIAISGAYLLFRTVIADSNIHERLSHEHERVRCDEELSARSNARVFEAFH